MKVEVQEYLDLVEATGKLAFVDIEASGLRGDYNSIHCISVKPFDKKPYTYSIKALGNDVKVVRDFKEDLKQYGCIATYYGSGFDLPMINTRLLKWGQKPLEPIFHIDLYYKLKSRLLTARKSQGHLLSFLETPEEKMSVSASAWSEMGFKLAEHLPTMIERCESDVAGLEALYKRTRHLIGDIKRSS